MAHISIRLDITLPGVEEVTEPEAQAVLDRLKAYVPPAVEEAGIVTGQTPQTDGVIIQGP